MDNNAKDSSRKARSHTKIIDDNTKNMEEEKQLLKTEVAKLKAEN